MEENKVKDVEPTTVEELIRDNDNLIYNCLELGNHIYNSLTNNNCLQENTQNAPTCMLENLVMQNNNLKILNETLNKIRKILFKEN